MRSLTVLCLIVAMPVCGDDLRQPPQPGNCELRLAEEVPECHAACQEDLSILREATAKYHREIDALADGFLATTHCIAGPPAMGAMGLHYPNVSRTRDLQVDIANPELLLYEPQGDGSVRLVGVEYFVPVLSNGRPWMGGANEPPPSIDNAAPVLFGRRFDGPMPPHDPGQPWHYDLHVWAWRHNSAGMFALFNRKVRCGAQ